MAACSRWVMLGTIAIALVAPAACRDASHTTPSFHEGLGTTDEPLPPTAPPTMTAKVAEGTAEFVAFRDPNAEPEPEETGDGAAGDAPAAEAAVDNSKIEEEIRGLVTEYNEAVAKGNLDDLVEFYVKPQQEPLKKIFDAYKDIKAKLTSTRATLAEKLPDAADRIDAAIKDILHESDMDLKVSSLTITSQTEVAAKVQPAAGRDTIHFRLMKDETGDAFWFMDDPVLKDPTAALAGMAMAVTGIGALETAVKGGAIPPEAALEQIEMMAKAAAAAREMTGVAPADDEGGEEPGDRAPDTGATADKAKVEAEIRDLAKEYNDAIDNEDYETVAEFFIESQRDAFKKDFASYAQMKSKRAALRKLLEERLPDAGDRIKAAFDVLDDESFLHLDIKSLTVASEKEVTAKVRTMMPSDIITFRLSVDEAGDAYWLIDDSTIIDQSPKAVKANSLIATKYETQIKGVSDGSMTPETVLQDIESVVSMTKKMIERTSRDDETREAKPAEKGD